MFCENHMMYLGVQKKTCPSKLQEIFTDCDSLPLVMLQHIDLLFRKADTNNSGNILVTTEHDSQESLFLTWKQKADTDACKSHFCVDSMLGGILLAAAVTSSERSLYWQRSENPRITPVSTQRCVISEIFCQLCWGIHDQTQKQTGANSLPFWRSLKDV